SSDVCSSDLGPSRLTSRRPRRHDVAGGDQPASGMITSAGRTAALVVLRGGGRCRSPWASLAEALQKRLGVGSCCPLAWGDGPDPRPFCAVPAPRAGDPCRVADVA